MKAFALGLAIQFAAVAAVSAQAPAGPPILSQHFRDVVQGTMQLTVQPGMRVGLAFAVCGEENAAYSARDRRIIVCLELATESDSVVEFVVAHEMAHAIVDQYDIPVPGSEEAAADELAAVMMGLADKSDVTLETALWYREQADQTEDVEDDHQSNGKRAAVLICLGAGSEPNTQNEECAAEYAHAARTWARLILTFGLK